MTTFLRFMDWSLALEDLGFEAISASSSACFCIMPKINKEKNDVICYGTIRDKVFKNGLSKYSKDCLPQNLLGPLLNTLLICLKTRIRRRAFLQDQLWKTSFFG